MDKILNKIIQFNTFYVIGVFRKENAEDYYVLKIEKKKNNVSLLSCESYSNFENLVDKLEKKLPCLICIDGKGIVNKKIDLKNESDIDWVKKLDYSTIDFLSFDTNENQFFSICRKSVSEEIIASFQQKGLQIIDVYIGPLAAALLNTFLEKNNLFANTTLLNYENESLINISKLDNPNDEFNYDIGEKKISKYHLPLYGIAIHFLTKHKAIHKNENTSLNTDNIYYKKAFETFGLLMLTGFFCLLLISYILIQYFNAKNTDLNLKKIYSNQTYDLVEKLEKQKEKKLEIVGKTGISSSKFNSFYNYEIVKSTPKGVNLSTIDAFPLMNEIKSGKEILFNSNHIILKGNTTNEMIFNNWITNIKHFTWVKSLEINSIKKDKKNTTFFELTLTLKNV